MDTNGLEMGVDHVQQSLKDYDAIVIPGGPGTRELLRDHSFLDWIRTANESAYQISVCTGSLILGAAGLLKDKKATTHFGEYETLRPYCKEVIKKRIVRDGRVITAGAVSSSIDLGIFLCREWAGNEAAIQISKRIDYQGNVLSAQTS
jgi:cyclohexyl-isocyanide hydratase